MATVKPGTKIVNHMISGYKEPGQFRFFEASSIRKIKDKYVFIYSRFTEEGEFGLPTTNYTLAYAYSDKPLGPWTYGGTIIDGRAREKDEQGNVIASANVSGNTHGSICEINGQWYVFYHRQSGLNEFARQAMVAPITVKVEEGEGGKVEISEGEYTSEGFALNGLNPLERHSAGICCWYTGPKVAIHEWPNNTFYGSYVEASYGTDDKFAAPYDIRNNTNYVVNNTDGSIVGYKYFNFDATKGRQWHHHHHGRPSLGVAGRQGTGHHRTESRHATSAHRDHHPATCLGRTDWQARHLLLFQVRNKREVAVQTLRPLLQINPLSRKIR